MRSDFPSRQLPDLQISNSDIEIQSIELRSQNSKWLLLPIYKHPKCDFEKFESVLTDLLNKAFCDYSLVVCIGDVNIDVLHGRNTHNDAYYRFLDVHDFKNLISDITCYKSNNGSTLDHIITNDSKMFRSTGAIKNGTSDCHNLIYGVMNQQMKGLPARKIQYRSYKNFDEKDFQKDIECAPWHVGGIFDDLDDKYWYFNTLLNDLMDHHVPLKSKTIRPKQPVFMNSKLRKCVNRKAQLYNLKCKYPTKANFDKYRKIRNRTSNVRKESIKNYFVEKCTSVSDRDMWPTINPFIGGKQKASNSSLHLLEEDHLITDPDQVASVMNDFYTNVANTIGEPFDPLTNNMTDKEFVKHSNEKFKNHPSITEIKNSVGLNTTFEFKETTPSNIGKLLKKLNPKKSQGYDKIPPRLLKSCKESLVYPLTYLINDTITLCHFPKDLKFAEVSPLYKKADHMKKENHRPVSLLPVVSKIYERTLNDQLVCFQNEILSCLISAYRAKYGTDSVLLHVTETWKRALDQKMYVGAMLMDLSKAFDCIPHDLLIAKLCAYGMSNASLELLSSYLRHRYQRVKVDGVCSEWNMLTKGVPQGSILGPILFNFFINDFILSLKQSKVANYADDNTIFVIDPCKDTMINVLTSECKVAISWFENNNMKANPEKFQLIYLGNHGIEQPVVLGPQCIYPVESVQLLGINIDCQLNFTNHISMIVKVAARKLNALKRLSHILNVECKLVLFRSYVLSRLLYCCIIWSFTTKANITMLEKLQKRGLRYVYSDYDSSYEELLDKSGLMSLESVWKRCIILQVFKIVHKSCPLYLCDLVVEKRNDYDMRILNALALIKPRTTKYGLKSFQYQGCKLWNQLPNSVKEIENVTAFNRNIAKL